MIWKSWHRIVVILITIIAIAVFAFSFVWPKYEWSLVLPSPDNQHVLIVLRGDAAAFADFSYRIYIFPKLDMPVLKAIGTPQLFTWPWRGNKYLAYGGFAYPMFRWTSKSSVEIDFHEASPNEAPADSVFSVGAPQDSIAIFLKSDAENVKNSLP